MGETALALNVQLPEEGLAVVDQFPLVVRVDQLEQDRWSQARYARWAGGLVMRSTIETPAAEEGQVEAPAEEEVQIDAPTSLAGSIDQLAANPELAGTEVEKLIDINVATAVIEVCFKEKHIKRVLIDVNEQGEHVQFGQTTQEMHGNSIVERPNRRPELQAFTRAEALNGHRAEDLRRAGKLEDYWLVVGSLVPTGLPEKDLGAEGDGYFLSGMTFALQGTTEENGHVVVESVFDNGVENGDDLSYEERQQARIDIASLAKVYERFGLEAPDGPLGYLQNPLLIHKSLLENGMVDFLRMVHEASDEVLDRTVERTEEDYQAIITQSAARDASLEETKRKVKADLLTYAGTFTKPMDAVDRLWKIIKLHVVDDSLTNMHINPMVFGAEAGVAVEKARYYARMGDAEAMQLAMAEAHEKAVIVGCGGGALGASSEAGSGNGDGAGEEQADIPDEIRCIKCAKKSPRDKVVLEESWRCPHCKYEIDICNGAVLHDSEPSAPAQTETAEVFNLLNYFRTSGEQASRRLTA